jgi:flavin-dependent dehydrogenase
MKTACPIGSLLAATNYSDRSMRCVGKNYAHIRDTGAFIDPLFSSGVVTVVRSAETAAERVGSCLENRKGFGEVDARRYEKTVRHRLDSVSWLT